MSELFPKPTLKNVDVMQIINSPEFQVALSQINMQLAMFSDETRMSPEDLASEQAALDAFNERFFGLSWLERDTITSLGVADQGDDEPPLVVDIDAKFIGAVPAVYEANCVIENKPELLGYRALSLYLVADNEPLAVPLHTGDIIDMQVELPPHRSEATTDHELLQTDNDTFTHLLNTQIFLGLDLATQKKQIESIVATICEDNPILDSTNTVHSVTIKSTGSDQVTTVTGDCMFVVFPALDEQITPYRCAADFPYGSQLWLEILNTTEGTHRQVPVNDIVTIKSRPEQQAADDASSESAQNIDMLGEFFTNPDTQTLIADAENSVNYCDDEAERAEIILEYLNQLSAVLPDNFAELAYGVSGVVYHEQTEDTFEPVFETYQNALACDFDIKLIGEKWKVVVPLDVSTEDTYQAPGGEQAVYETVYVIPSRDNLILFEAYEDTDTIIIDQVDPEVLLAATEQTSAIIERALTSRRFYKQTLEQQHNELQREIKPLQQDLEQMINIVPKCNVSCLASRYYRNDWSLGGTSCADYAQLICVEQPSGMPALLEGDNVSIGIPELNEERNQRYVKRRDFVFSHGILMYTLDNSSQQCTYFIPASDLVHIMPFIDNT